MSPADHFFFNFQVNEVTMKEMQLLLEFMYKGNVAIPSENYEKVAKIAEQLEMKNFKKLRVEGERVKVDVNKMVADYPDVTVKTKVQTETEEEETPQEESEESHEDETSEPQQQQKPHKVTLSCKICQETFMEAKKLMLHVRNHSAIGKKPYICDYCPAGFKRASHLTRHKLIHTGEKPYSCNTCDKSFSRLDKLKQHNRNAHKSESTRMVRVADLIYFY